MASSNSEAWDGQPWEIDTPRMLHEYTADTLKEKYRNLREADMEALIRFPVLFACAIVNRMPARIGWITRIRQHSNAVRIEYTIDPLFPPIGNERILEFSGSSM